MSYEEKGVWVYLGAGVLTYAVYLTIVLRRADGGPLTDVHYVPVLLWMLAVSVGFSVLGRIAFEVARPSESSAADVRDKEVRRFGEYVGGSLLSIAVVGVLVLAVLEVDHFWIANAIYLAFVLQAVVSSVARLVAYRRGLVPW